jgi:hydroxymethylglutaryl-CoA synthase
MINKVGIDNIGFYTPRVYLDLATLATARGVDASKYKIGIGQEKMSLIMPFEDIVTMAAEAAYDIIQGQQESIGMVLFATESGIDFSKAAGIYLLSLLGLPSSARVLEVKQACYAATGALHLAKDYVMLHPNKKALVIASDVAWYGLKTPGEITQGAGAIALLISTHPRLAIVEDGQAAVENIEDFYRPTGQEVPIVDGKLSIRSYKNLLVRVIDPHHPSYVCFHMPFATMANKANESLPRPMNDMQLNKIKKFNKEVGNIYNGSLYLSLISLLTEQDIDLSGQRVGMFAYGSGATSEYFTITIQPQYQNIIQTNLFMKHVQLRKEVSYETYESLMTTFAERERTLEFIPDITSLTDQRFVLKAIVHGHRQYQQLLK